MSWIYTLYLKIYMYTVATLHSDERSKLQGRYRFDMSKIFADIARDMYKESKLQRSNYLWTYQRIKKQTDKRICKYIDKL